MIHTLFIDKILLFNGLKHNLLSKSHLCANGYNVLFNRDKHEVKNIKQ